jgi:hypothetical protein
VFGIVGWSSLFAFTGNQYGNQELSGVIQFWSRIEHQVQLSDSQVIAYRTAFLINNVRLWLKGEVVPGYVGYHIEAECLTSPQIKEASINWWVARGLEIKAGRFPPDFTLYGAASVDALESPYFPLINQCLGPGRQIGIEITEKSRYVQLYGGLFNTISSSESWSESDNFKDVLLRSDVTIVDFARLILEGIYGEEIFTTIPNREHLLAGIALKVDWEQLISFRAEWIRRWRETYSDLNYLETREQVSQGILLHLGYHFTSKLETFARYEWFDGDLGHSVMEGLDEYRWRECVTLGNSYHIIPNRFKITGYYLHRAQESGLNYWNTGGSWTTGEEAILELQLSF